MPITSEREPEQDDAEPEVARRGGSRVASTSATKPPTKPPIPSAALSQPTPGVSRVEQLERDEHDEDVQRPGDERLRRVERR